MFRHRSRKKNKKFRFSFSKDFGKVSASADDDIYQMLGRSYINRISDTNRYCSTGDTEVGTITRGADWYEVIGGMQDYGYLRYGTLEMTMEISCCKYPFSNVLANYWSYNRDAMVELLLQAQRGSSSSSPFFNDDETLQLFVTLLQVFAD